MGGQAQAGAGDQWREDGESSVLGVCVIAGRFSRPFTVLLEEESAFSCCGSERFIISGDSSAQPTPIPGFSFSSFPFTNKEHAAQDDGCPSARTLHEATMFLLSPSHRNSDRAHSDPRHWQKAAWGTSSPTTLCIRPGAGGDGRCLCPIQGASMSCTRAVKRSSHSRWRG